MTKKKINIILILLVLGLWGTVGYRALYRQFSDSEVTNIIQDQKYNVSIKQINKDTFELEKINRDPFLNRNFQVIVVPKKNTSEYSPKKQLQLAAPQKKKAYIEWPQINYFGYIGSKEKGEDIILVMINSELCKLKLNTPLKGITIKKRYKDSIEVYFNSDKKMIKSQKL
ncbi:hypothetical protein [Flavobacterium gyeonganense]|uniref:Uncharacterized protein n=1 Tax=Flavobacterium gyeonganense TaxID=1310418 RepID=A0ABV5HA46_9FLAO|nr:hypothetical protein [Flavobacterium gyeonganense]